jgi:ATP synthase protein I
MSPAKDPKDPKDPDAPEKEGTFEARVSDLGERLARASAQQRSGGEVGVERAAELSGRGMAYGMRMAAELVAAVIVGGALGIGLDKWLGTWPWLFLLFFLLGFAAGVLNVVRAYGRIAKEISAATGGRIGQAVADDEDDA